MQWNLVKRNFSSYIKYYTPIDGFTILMKFKEGSIFVISLTTYSQSQSPFIAKEGSSEIILQCYEPFSHPPENSTYIYLSKSVCKTELPARGLLYGGCFIPKPRAPECTEWLMQSVCRGSSAEVTYIRKSHIFPTRNQITLGFFSKTAKVVHGLFTCGVSKCDFKWSTACSHWKCIELKLKFGFHGFWCLWLFT